MTQKGFIPILILILIIVAALGGYLVYQNQSSAKPFRPLPTAAPDIKSSPTPDETANWKTYTNQKFLFSLSYPENIFKFFERQIENETDLFLRLSNLNDERESEIRMYVQVSQNNNTMEDYLNKELNKSSDKQAFTINGISGFSYYHNPVGSSGLPEVPTVFSYNFFIKNKNNLYQISLTTEKGEEYLKEKKALFNQILSTFKFTN